MRSTCLLAFVFAPVLAACASPLADASNDQLVRQLVEIRPYDGHTGFNTPDGPRSYGWEAQEVLVDRKAGAVPALAGALRDPALDGTQRTIVRNTIGEIGVDAGQAVPALVEEMKSADAWTASNVCFALRRIGPSAKAAVPDLLALLRTRGDEIVAPGVTSGDVVVPAGRLRTIVASTLGAIRGGADAALPVLAEGAVRTDDVAYRQVCRRAMRDILGPPDAAQ